MLFKKQKGLLEITKLKAELPSRKLKDSTEEISQKEQKGKIKIGRGQKGNRTIQEKKYKKIKLCCPTSNIIEIPRTENNKVQINKTRKFPRLKNTNSQI